MNKLVFGQPVQTKTQIKKQKKLAKEQQNTTSANWRASEIKAMKVLNAARRADDPQFLYCIYCHRMIGWHQIIFSHDCEQHGAAFWWTDLRRGDAEAIAAYELPGTLWYESA